MNSNPVTIINRIKSARIDANRSIKVCADFLRISLDRYVAYETGTLIPSLPEIELLAFFLNIPISAILENNNKKSPAYDSQIQKHFDVLINLRNKIIGAKIRVLRNEKNLSAAELASKADFCEGDLDAYELGITPIRLSILKRILDVLDSSYLELIDEDSILSKRQRKGDNSLTPSLCLQNGNLEFLDKLSFDELINIYTYLSNLINNHDATFNSIDSN